MKTRRNLAATAGRWSARHRWTAVGLWLAFVVASVALGGMLKTQTLTSTEATNGQAQRAQEILEGAGFDLPSNEVVYLHSDTETATSPAFRAAVDAVVAGLKKHPEARDVASPADTKAVSADGHSALVQFKLAGDTETVKTYVKPLLETVAQVQREHSALRVEQFGEATFAQQYDEKLDKDYGAAELYSFPVTLLILIVAFGTLVAAFLPILLAATAVTATTGLLAVTSQALHVDKNGSSVMALVGIAVGIDYSLFYIRRFREERARGASTAEAVETAAATSGRSVLVSGMAVVIAMAGMFFSGNGIQIGIAESTILVVLIAVVGSLTVLPAMLALLGDRTAKGRIPFLHKLSARRTGAGWDKVLGWVLRKPVVAALISGGALLALAAPATLLHTSDPGFGDLQPDALPALQTYQRIQDAFPGSSAPAKIVVKSADVTSPEARAAIEAFQAQAPQAPGLRGPVTTAVNADHTVALLTVGLTGNGTDEISTAALDVLRGSVIPSTLGKLPATEVKVAGVTASSVDTNEQLSDRIGWVAGFVLLLTFVIMLLSFRSVVIAGTTLLLNLLSVGGAYGVVVLVFQYGWGADLLNFTSTGGIASWVPMFMFVILFGLSMDYHVFIVSRIREAYDRGLPTPEAIKTGIRGSAGVVTSAAIVMVAVAGVFGMLPQLSMKEAGVGMSTAVLLDATLIRAILLPAIMRLLGERNWYLPRALNWLPALAHGESAPVPAAPPARTPVTTAG
ncbi:putative drug exporter of the RND superfamily/hypothetical protein [Amycolatopsis xylanica]|uniref:Membrane transport protein MMPL domain-containing protein n=1 Tax=Amycolatopsis xylanica TaxID=589385 RepID=A0A1H2W9F1_9PSEU|nr:MMPL family transporter [Amycolatopsis xylanica]SDW77161.1 putative drug exporter of the RND superfamily/hypothetical protein [Amycolatopsis xylanica]